MGEPTLQSGIICKQTMTPRRAMSHYEFMAAVCQNSMLENNISEFQVRSKA